MARPWWWWCTAAVLAVLLARGAGSSVAPAFRVRNLSRRSEVLQRNDVVEVSCLNSTAPVVAWRVSSNSGARIVSESNEMLVAAFDRAGLVGVEAVVRPNGADDVALSLILTVDEINGVCFVWHSCFVLTDDDDDDEKCVASWDAFSDRRAVLTLRIWAGYAADPSVSLPGVARTSPSAQEVMLSAELYALGERPTVTLPVQPFESSLGPPVQVDHLGLGLWQADRGLWQFSVRPAWTAPQLFGGRTLELLVTGLSVSVLGCATPQTQRLFLDLTSVYVPMPATSLLQSPRAGADRAVRFDVCSSMLLAEAANAGYLLYSQEVGGLWGRGARRANLTLYAPSSGAGSVLDFAPSRLGLLVLSKSGLLRLPSLASDAANTTSGGTGNQSSEQALGPLGGATRLATAAGCDRLLDSADRTRNDVVAAWDGNSSNVKSVMLSHDGGMTWGAPLVISTDPRFAEGFTVREAMPLVSAPRVVVVASVNESDHVFLLDEHSGNSTLAATFGASASLPALGPSLGLSGPLLQSGEILLWGAGGLFYSTSTGLTWRTVALERFDLSAGTFVPAALADGDSVVGVATSAAGDLAVLTRAGRIFETKLGLSTAYELYSPLRQPATSWPPAALRYYGSELAAVQAASDGAQAVELFSVLRRQYAAGEAINATQLSADELTALAVAGGLSRPFLCPFLAWTRKDPRDSYYADMNDKLVATVRLTHPARTEGFHISFQTSSRTYLDMIPQPEVVSSNEDSSIVLREREVILAVPPNVTARTGLGQRERAAGKVIVRASPTLYTPGCGNTASLIEVNVGCPRGRHLRYRAPDAYAEPSLSVISAECAAAPDVAGCVCDKYRGRQYQIASELVDRSRMASYYGTTRGHKKGYVTGLEDPAADTLEYPYDYDTFGCPTFVPYTAQFKPVLEIWDFDTFVKVVSAEFVLAEVHGRRELSYGEIASQAGCATPPDTWAAKLAKEADISKAWGSHNYRPCVQRNASMPSSTEPWASLPFEVLSPASTNYIGFAKNSSTVPLLFYAFVVDPDYSFCPLSTAFSVEVYGMPLSSWATYLIVLSVVSLSLLLLAFTYVMHRSEILQAAASDALRERMGEGAKVKTS